MDAPAKIQYFHPEYAAHLTLFHCTRLLIDLSPEACAKRHARQEDYPCSTCPIGARHAAELGIPVVRDKTRAAHTRPCCRCGRHEFRLIGARMCVSCWNREREWKIGTNRKGGKPTICLRWFEALVIAPEGLTTRRNTGAGITVQGLSGSCEDFSMRMAALDSAEVERAILALWPGVEIIAIGPTGQPETVDDQRRRNSAKQAERMPGSEIA